MPLAMPSNTLKVLLIRPAALGDTLMLMPAIARLKALTEITLVGRSPGIDFLRPFIPFCMDYERAGWHKLFLDNAHAFPLPSVDRVVAFLGDADGSVKKNLRAQLPSASIHLFPAFPPKEEKIHVALYLSQCLQHTGLPIDPTETIEEAKRRPLLEKNPLPMRQGKMIFHPGSGGEKKNYPPVFWLELIQHLRMSFLNEKEKFIVLLGPAEEKVTPFFSEKLANREAEIVHSPQEDKLTSLLKEAPLYIGHDSGITHLAAMLGTPTIALFKDSPVRQWSPLGPAVRVLKNEKSRSVLIEKILNEGKELMS